MTKTFAAVSLMTPMGAYALGVGDIKLHSALNQNLDAEIALVLSDAEKLGDVKVRLAPPSKFEEAGVPWSHFLSQIKFKTITKPNGAVVLKLTSEGVLQEPFLDFLLEVSWPKGDIYREFTVLVDPPAVYQQQVISVAENASETPKLQPSTYANVTNSNQGISTQSIAQSNSGVNEYGPTGSRDTLWKIAEKVIGNKNISVEQMMIALYEANPKAFYKPNVNALSSGVTLTVPDDNIVLRLSDRQAKQAFAKQVSAWRGKVTTASTTSASQEKNNASLVSNQLQLKAPTEAEINDRVRVTPGVDQDLQNSARTSDEAVSFGQENQELKNRLDKLEEQLASMQQMLAVKDEQLAALQSKELKQENKKSTEQSGVTQSEIAKPQVTKKVVKPKPSAQPLAENESDSSLYNIIISTAAIGALGLLGLVWWRKRKAEDEINSESMFASSSQISLPETDKDLTVPVAEASKNVSSTTSYDVGSVGESSFLSEFTPSDFDAFETDQAEVDPISEADVYLAYGRYQQAEELMQQAIKNAPDRDECKLKLLEIFYASENQQAFEGFAGELVSKGKNEDVDFWAKVTEMGKELCPDNRLFIVQTGKQNEDSSNVAPQNDPAEDEVLQLNFSSDDDSSKSEVVENEDESGLEFDITSLEEEGEAIVSEDLSLSGETNNNEIDFDLGGIDKEALKTSDSNPSESNTSGDDEVETFDLSAEALSEKDDDLTNFDFGNADGKDDTFKSELSTEPEEFNFEFDLDQPKSSPKESKLSDLSTVADLTDMDELETKIDLAKAYIDMGDADAAKNIAKEVLEKGSDTQKQEAQEIINQI